MVALGLDRFAAMLPNSGATKGTVAAVRLAAAGLLWMDLALAVAAGAAHMVGAIWCLAAG